MNEIWTYSLISVGLVSLISLIGVFTLAISVKKLERILVYMISFSAGALFGDAFIHLLPELVEEVGFSIQLSTYVISGIILFFIIEKVIHWRHCHMPMTENHIHSFAMMNLVGDSVHNFIDGLIIGASYLVSIPAGIATTIAVALHEIPQEISDFGVLLYGGFSKWKALLINFLTALTAVFGTVLTLWLNVYASTTRVYLVAIAVGGFIYIAGSDLIPELHKEHDEGFHLGRVFLQVITFVFGVAVMIGLTFLE